MAADLTTAIVDAITTTATTLLTTDSNNNNVDTTSVSYSSSTSAPGAGGQGGDEGSVHIQPKTDDMMAQMLSTAQRMHWAASVVVGPIFVMLGLLGNVLSIIVWTRRHMRSSTGRYLTALAMADIGVLLWFIMIDTVMMLWPELGNSPGYAVFFAYLGYPVFFLWVVCSIWFMVGVTVDRFIMVCLITRAKEFCNESRANVGIGLIGGLCFLINLPHFWSFTIDWDQGGPESNGTGPALIKTDFQKGDAGIRYEFWVHCIFLVLVPWFTVFTLNLLIISKIGKTNRKMSNKKSAQSADKCRHSENQITRLLLTVTFTFLVLIGFQCITQCFYMLMPDGFDKNVIDEAFAVAKLGVIINSSINFLLYCFSGRRFRQELLNLLGCRRRGLALFTASDHSSSSGGGTGGVGSGTTSGTGTTGV